MEILACLILLVTLHTSHAQFPFPSACPRIAAVKPFDVAGYSGNWFEAERYFFLPEITGRCVSLNFTLQDDGTLDTQVRFTESFTGAQMVWPGETNLVDAPVTPADRNGNLQLTLSILNPFYPSVGVQKTYSYRVVATDYTTYAIHWSCYNLVGVHFESVWVLARDITYPSAVRTNVRRQLDSLGIEKNILKRSDQNDCDGPGVMFPTLPVG